MDEKSSAKEAKPAAAKPAPAPKEVIVRPMPAILHLWPAMVIALVFGIMASFPRFKIDGSGNAALGLIFTLFFFANLLSLFIQFTNRRTVILAVFVICLLILSAFFWEKISAFFVGIGPGMDNRFYFVWFGLLAIIDILAILNARFEYWVIRPDEVVHHAGVFGKTVRHAAPRLRVEKEIPDVLSYILLRSGQLTVYTSTDARPINLENIVCVNTIEKRLTALAAVESK